MSCGKLQPSAGQNCSTEEAELRQEGSRSPAPPVLICHRIAPEPGKPPGYLVLCREVQCCSAGTCQQLPSVFKTLHFLLSVWGFIHVCFHSFTERKWREINSGDCLKDLESSQRRELNAYLMRERECPFLFKKKKKVYLNFIF